MEDEKYAVFAVSGNIEERYSNWTTRKAALALMESLGKIRGDEFDAIYVATRIHIYEQR